MILFAFVSRHEIAKRESGKNDRASNDDGEMLEPEGWKTRSNDHTHSGHLTRANGFVFTFTDP